MCHSLLLMTDTVFLKRGTRFDVTTKETLDLHPVLPGGTYTIKIDPSTGAYYIDKISDFEINHKIYGDSPKNADRILNTFKTRPASTGVVLSGEKGGGKSLLAKSLSILARESGIPTIVINQPHAGEGFNDFMQKISQPTVIIFDEFEKVYDRETQEQLLTLLDGVYPSKKLFVFTSNDPYRIDQHMRNRPGRIFYRIDYKGLDKEFIVEYCEDNLKDQSQIGAVCRVALMFTEFNFDLLKGLVEEMNRYDETPQEAMRLLNAKPEAGQAATFDVTLAVKGKQFSKEELEHYAQWRGNPLSGIVTLGFPTGEKDEDGDEEWDDSYFLTTDLKSIDHETGKFHFTNEQGHKLELVKHQPREFNMMDF
jgi:hypothetical protein